MPAVAIALGAMTDLGVLHDLGRDDLLATLTRSGLTHLQKHHLDKIVEAAIVECADPDSKRAVILTGLEMFERVDGKLVGSQDQTMLYWPELPELGHLQQHRRTWDDGHQARKANLLADVRLLPEHRAVQSIQSAFVDFLGGLLGLDSSRLDGKNPLAAYGLDSLSGVSCQYWFHRGKVPYPQAGGEHTLTCTQSLRLPSLCQRSLLQRALSSLQPRPTSELKLPAADDSPR